MYSDVYYFCDNEKKAYWIIALYIYKGLLLLMGCFLAWETRHVSFEEINDSRSIGVCIYNVVIFCVLGFPLAHVLDIRHKTLTFALEAFLSLICTTVIQCIIFIPKVSSPSYI